MLRRLFIARLGLAAALSLLLWGLTSSANLLQMPFTVTGGAGLPVNTTGPQVSGSIAVAANTLTCSGDTWSNGPITSTAYAWYRDGGTSIGTNSANYTTVASDLGHLITCKTTATNSTGPAASASPASNPAGNCTQSSAFFGRVWVLPATLDGTMGTSSSGIVTGGTLHLSYYDALICNLVTDTVWAKLDALWMPATNTLIGSNTAVANLNLVSSSYTLMPSGSPSFVADRGYTGTDVSTTVWIDTQFNPALGTPQIGTAPGESHVSIWALNNVQSDGASGYGKALGAGNAGLTTATIIVPWDKDGKMDCAIGDDISTSAATQVVSSSSGQSLCEHTAGQALHFRSGVEVGSAITRAPAGSWFSGNIYLLNWNWTTKNGGPWQIAQASLGASLSYLQISSSYTTTGTSGTGLVPRVCAYLHAVGAVTAAC